MLKAYLIELYVYFFEKIFSSNNKLGIDKSWKNLKEKKSVLEYATKCSETSFNSKIICYMILKDKDLFNSKAYFKIINEIFKNNEIADMSINNDKVFLLLALENENLVLTKEQKDFLFNKLDSVYNEINMDENISQEDIAFDIRYNLLKSNILSIQEKVEFFVRFYTDDLVKLLVLESLEDEINLPRVIMLQYQNFLDLYDLSDKEIKKLIPETKDMHIFLLCKELRKKIPDSIIKYYKKKY